MALFTSICLIWIKIGIINVFVCVCLPFDYNRIEFQSKEKHIAHLQA